MKLILIFSFSYHGFYKSTSSLYTRYTYTCAQSQDRQHKPQKSARDGVQARDKGQMKSFACKSWLRITIYHDNNTAYVNLTHREKHVDYWCVDIPRHIQEMIKKECDLSPTQVQFLFNLEEILILITAVALG